MLLLREDRQRAQVRSDPHANFATLATVECEQPAARVVTMRLQQDDRLLVSANATSRKARALRANPLCELLIYWTTLQRQYRLRGRALFVPAEQLPALYEQVPWRSKTWDRVYQTLPQSTRVASRDEFVKPFREGLAALQAVHANASEVLPTPSSGYIAIVPDVIEIQELELEERLHDRRRFERQDDGTWTQQLLVP